MLESFLQEDVGSGDVTSENVIPASARATAEIVCKSATPAVVSGLEEAALVFDLCGCSARLLVSDGTTIKKGKVVMKISGGGRGILKAERTALNLMMRMSGISTETKRLVNMAKGVKILATRKTAPGLRYFDKKAVVLGGGGAHRMRLDDMILIKDNHIALAGPAEKCVKAARKNGLRIECEVRNRKEAIGAATAGADIVMLDNFTPARAKSAIRTLEKLGLRKNVKIEISGGVNSENIRNYVSTRPDFISLGSLTHSPRAVDFSLEITRDH